MPSIYIQPQDYATYGLDPIFTTEAQIIQASAMVDAYCLRQEYGMLHEVDNLGNPLYMTAKVARFAVNNTATILAGDNVVVTVTGPYNTLKPGDVLILDRINLILREACVIQSRTGNTVTLKRVIYNHASGITMEAGLVITEERGTPSDRNIIQLTQPPIARVLSGQGMYGYVRRGDSVGYDNVSMNASLLMAYGGGPPIYEFFDVDQESVMIEAENGLIYYPTGIMLLHYTKVRMSYIAGWTYDSLPYMIKQATANLVKAVASAASYGMIGGITGLKQGDTSITRFGGKSGIFSIMDQDTRDMLAPYTARRFI